MEVQGQLLKVCVRSEEEPRRNVGAHQHDVKTLGGEILMFVFGMITGIVVTMVITVMELERHIK